MSRERNMIRRILQPFIKLWKRGRSTSGRSSGTPSPTLNLTNTQLTAGRDLSVTIIVDGKHANAISELPGRHVRLPLYLSGLQRTSRWEIQSICRNVTTEHASTFSAQIEGRVVIVKEFHGRDAIKRWIASAKIHSSVHFAPEFLRIEGVSQESETEETNDDGFNPFLVFNGDRLAPVKWVKGESLRGGALTLDCFLLCKYMNDYMSALNYLNHLRPEMHLMVKVKDWNICSENQVLRSGDTSCNFGAPKLYNFVFCMGSNDVEEAYWSPSDEGCVDEIQRRFNEMHEPSSAPPPLIDDSSHEALAERSFTQGSEALVRDRLRLRR